MLAALILIPLILIRLLVLPLTQAQDRQAKKSKELESQIQQIETLGPQLAAQGSLAGPSPEGLTARLSRVMKKTGVIERASLVSQNTPGAAQSLLVQLDGLTLTEMAQTVYQIEHLQPRVLIENLDLQKSFQNEKRLKLALLVSSK